MELGLLVRQIPFGLFLLGDFGHHRHCAATRHPIAQNAVPAAVGRAILEALARRIAQALHAPRHQGLDITLAVIAVLSEIPQKIGIRTAGLQQLARHPVHVLEAVVAKNDVQILVRENERARHVIERDLKMCLHTKRQMIGQTHVAQSRHGCPRLANLRPLLHL